jgi:hypothetical protein
VPRPLTALGATSTWPPRSSTIRAVRATSGTDMTASHRARTLAPAGAAWRKMPATLPFPFSATAYDAGAPSTSRNFQPNTAP